MSHGHVLVNGKKLDIPSYQVGEGQEVSLKDKTKKNAFVLEAVISQQLNTRPVAPSWHNAEVRPELEALVLELLEKTPGSRPPSAAAVRERIQQIREREL